MNTVSSPSHPCIVYNTYIYHKNLSNVGKYTIQYMDGMGSIVLYISTSLGGGANSA